MNIASRRVELYELGKRQFAKKDLKTAGEHLTSCWRSGT